MFDYEQMAPAETDIKRDITKVVKRTSIGSNNTLMFPKASSVTLLVSDNKPLTGEKSLKL